MANILDNYLNMLMQGPMMGSDRFEVATRITKGIHNPIGKRQIEKLYGSSDEFMERFKNIEDFYKSFLAAEMGTNTSIPHKRMLEAAQASPIMNFGLIKNRTNRAILDGLFMGTSGINMEGILANIGAPSIPLQSSNLISEAGRYGIDTANADHFAATLLSSLTISIDPTKQGVRAFGVGRTAIPTSKTLENMGKTRQRLQDIVSSGRAPVIMTLDTETSGVGPLSDIRSLALTRMEFDSTLQGGTNTPVFSTHFTNPEMQKVSVYDRLNNKFANLADVAFETEKSGDFFESTLRMSDLTTPQGRLEAVDSYKQALRLITAPEVDLLQIQNAKFDIEKIQTSIFTLGEDFFGDTEAADLFKGFQTMVEEGRVIDTLHYAREEMTAKAYAAIAGETDPVVAANKFRAALFAPETLVKAAIGGTASYAGIENFSLKSNLLQLIDTEAGPEGVKFIDTLASGTHIAQADTILTNYLSLFLTNGKINLDLPQTTAALPDRIKDVRRAIARSAPPTPTTNIAHVQHMSDAVFNYVANTNRGLRGVKLSTDTGSTISYSAKERGFIETSVDAVTAEVSQTRLSDQNAAMTRVRNETLKLNDPALRGSSEVIDLGVSFGEHSRTSNILEGISRSSSISPMMKTSPTDLVQAMMERNNIGADERLIEGLAATREHIKFDDFQRPETVKGSGILDNISKTDGLISEAQKNSYLETLSKSGIGGVVDDPYLRRNFVEIATITSAVPYGLGLDGKPKTDYAESIIKERHAADQLKAIADGSVLEDLTEEQLAAKINYFNTTGRQNSKLLSEFGVSHFEEQKFVRLFGASPDEISSRLLLPTSMLKEIEITGSKGTKYKLFSDEFMADYQTNKFGLSVVESDGKKTINVVFGNLAGREKRRIIEPTNI